MDKSYQQKKINKKIKLLCSIFVLLSIPCPTEATTEHTNSRIQNSTTKKKNYSSSLYRQVAGFVAPPSITGGAISYRPTLSTTAASRRSGMEENPNNVKNNKGTMKLESKEKPPFMEYNQDMMLPSNRPISSLSVQQEDGVSIKKPIPEPHQDAKSNGISKLEISLFITYFCNALTMMLPVIIVPLIASEHCTNPRDLAAFVASIASVGTLGGGLGKFVNGFICQRLGGKQASSTYLMGMVSMYVILSIIQSRPLVSLVVAGIEFSSSIQWPSCSSIFANHYAKSPALFARGITVLSLASTSGTLAAKLGGATLYQLTGSWRFVARCGALVALTGSLVMRMMVTENPPGKSSVQRKNTTTNSIPQALKSVLGNKLFWVAGFAHATSFVGKNSDKILGTYLQKVTTLSSGICGGLTASVTFGLVYGLTKASNFQSITDIEKKTAILKKLYTRAVVAALGLALCGTRWVPPGVYMAPIVSLCSAIMASSLAFQFYQIPPMVSNSLFRDNSAVCLSFLDGLGFFLSAPTWAATGQIVKYFGWPAAWLLLASLFALGRHYMMTVFPTVAQAQQKLADAAADDE